MWRDILGLLTLYGLAHRWVYQRVYNVPAGGTRTEKIDIPQGVVTLILRVDVSSDPEYAVSVAAYSDQAVFLSATPPSVPLRFSYEEYPVPCKTLLELQMTNASTIDATLEFKLEAVYMPVQLWKNLPEVIGVGRA